MPPTIYETYPVATGGAVRLQFATAVSGTVTLARATSGVGGLSAFTTIYSGAPLADNGSACYWLDTGDALPTPLQPGSLYVYRLTDGTGTVTTSGIAPVGALNIEQDQLSGIMTRLLTAGLQNLQLPAGMSHGVRVLQAMPNRDWPPLPIVVINQDLIQQEALGIGDTVEQPGVDNLWVIAEQARRLFRVSAISSNALERAFLRDAVIGIWKAAVVALAPLGYDIRHSFQAADYQASDEVRGLSPGFYGSDILLEVTGQFNLAITTSYGLINTITATVPIVSGSASGFGSPAISGVSVTAQVPLASG